MRHRHLLSGALLALAGLSCSATNGAVSATPFADFGLYHRGSVDTVENVLILPDRSFCLGVMAGSLDLLAAGRWTAAGDGIVLDEVKPVSPPVVILWQASPQPEHRGKILFEFSGRTFGRQGRFLFGTSSGDQLPGDLRPLFSPDANGFGAFYSETRPIGMKTFVLAYPGPVPSEDGIYHVLHYRLPDVPAGAGLRMRLYYDEQAARAPLHLSATMSAGSLMIDERSFGKPAPISQDDRAGCAAVLKKVESGPDLTAPAGTQRLAVTRMSDTHLQIASSSHCSGHPMMSG